MSGLIVERETPNHGGTQRIYRYPNGYGASVVRHEDSYGGPEGFWELAVIHWTGEGDDDWEYAIPATDGVLGWLSDHEVDERLAEIEALPPKPSAALYRRRKPAKAEHEKGIGT